MTGTTRVAARFLVGTPQVATPMSGDAQSVQVFLCDILGMLRALHWLHWTAHWQVKGNPSYGDHLLFERLYTGIVDEIDTLAEKLVGAFGSGAVDALRQVSTTQDWLAGWMSKGDTEIARALAAENQFQGQVRAVYEAVKSAGGMTLGLDDFLMSMANAHETNVYLLRQRLGGVRTAGKDKLSSAEAHFFDRPSSREVREFARSKAISNDEGVAANALKADELFEATQTMKRQVSKSPLTTKEILDLPGSGEFSTLNRYLVETTQPTDAGVPQGREDIPKHPKIVASVTARWMARVR